MYLPPHFEEKDQAAVAELIEHFPLAVMVCSVAGEMVANHIPLILTPDNRLIGHVALANDLHEIAEDNAKVLAIFKAEDSYISPNWYPTKAETHRHVPTWNYQVVHIHGRVQFSHDDKDKRAVVGKLTKFFEAQYSGDKAWKMADAPKDYMDEMINNIVAFSITIDQIVAKSKLGQNRLQVDFDNVTKEMKSRGKPALHQAMKRVRN